MKRSASSTLPDTRALHPSDVPAYSIAEVAHWLHLPQATARAWSLGQSYRGARGERKRFQNVIRIADPAQRLLSFRNLVEIHVLAAIRREHEISLQNVRRAVMFIEKRLGVPHPLADQKMLTDGTDLLVEHAEDLLNVSKGGQYEMKPLLRAYLRRIDHDAAGAPIALYPFAVAAIEDERRPIVIDPRVQFGRPCVSGTGIPTTIVAERFSAGESLADLARDYSAPLQNVEEAVRYELRLAA